MSARKGLGTSINRRDSQPEIGDGIGVNCIGPGDHRDDCSVAGTPSPRHDHTTEGITSTISKLEALEELLPSVVRGGSDPSIRAVPYRTVSCIGVTIDMLKSYRRIVEAKEKSDRHARENELIRKMYDSGIIVGIEQERSHAREARKGRKGGAKKAGEK